MGSERHGTPALLVIVLNWRRPVDTVRAVTSVRMSSVPADVLVVDNGSGDGSVDELHDWDPSLRCLELTANRGFAGGVNAGLARAHESGYDYVCLLNDDALLEPTALQAMLDHMETYQEHGAAAAKIVDARTGGVQTAGGGSINWLTGRETVCRGNPRTMTFLGGTCLMLRNSALRQVGYFDDRFFMYWEDADLSVRMRRAGWGLGYVADARVRHEGGTALGRAAPLAQEQYLTSMVLFFRKHCVWWPLPVAMRLTSALLERVWRRDCAGLRAVVRSGRALVHSPAPMEIGRV